MKILLLILTIAFAGINCQAQDKKCVDIIRHAVSIGRTADGYLLDYCDCLQNRIDLLEKRITELEYNCLVTKVDSVIISYSRYYAGKDSSYCYVDSASANYQKRYRVEPFKKPKK
jgi:hypothetical protein